MLTFSILLYYFVIAFHKQSLIRLGNLWEKILTVVVGLKQ